MSVPRRRALRHRLDEVGQPVGPHLSRVETLVLGIMAEEIVVVLVVAQADHGEIRIAALRHWLHRDQRNVAMALVAQNPLEGGGNLALGAFQRLHEPAVVANQGAGDAIARIIGNRGRQNLGDAAVLTPIPVVEPTATEIGQANEHHGYHPVDAHSDRERGSSEVRQA
jgi:hypothetical protein